MAGALTYGRPETDEEHAAAISLIAPIFHIAPEQAQQYRELIGDANRRVVRCGGEIAGGLNLIHMGQYFGGRSVSMAGIAAVGVAPEFRARGVASHLMSEVLRELHREQRCAISTLYPATDPLYRKAGYEHAGARFIVTLPLKQIDVHDHALDIELIREEQHDAIESLYRRFAQSRNGMLDRAPFIWRRARNWRGNVAQGYLVREQGEITGYLYSFIKGTDGEAHVIVTDHVAATSGAARRLLTFLADHRSMEQTASWHAGPSQPMLMHLREHEAYDIRYKEQWMTRIVDVERALRERGYSPHVEAEVHLQVRDDIIEANDDRFQLQVSGGAAKVTRGGRGEIDITMRGLAALFTGHRTVHDLRIAGLADIGGDETAASAADAIFAGPEPWLGDMF